jgi:hypothetical protein
LRVLRFRTHFRRHHGRRVQFSCFARPESFSTVPRASVSVLMFCDAGLVFGGTEGVGFRFHVLRCRTRFRRYRGRHVPFSYFARPESFSAVLRASGPVFMFCAPALIFGGTEVVRFLFHEKVLLESFSAVPRASGLFFTFTAPGLIFGGTEGGGSRFQVLRSRTRVRRYRVSRVPVFMFCPPVLVFGGAEGVGFRINVLHARTRFRRYRGRRVPFSCFALPDSFSTVPRASGLVSMFYAPGLVFNGTEGVRSRFHVLRSRTRFRRYRGRLVPFSCFALPESF